MDQHVALAVSIGLAATAVVAAIHVLLTTWSHRSPRAVQNLSGNLTDWLTRLLLYRLTSRQEYTQADISPYFWVNGRPPAGEEWSEVAKDGFACWKLQVKGLVEQPKCFFSLAELRALPSKRQITQHCCIQGWSAFAGVGPGVPLAEILQRCRVHFPQARLSHLPFPFASNG